MYCSEQLLKFTILFLKIKDDLMLFTAVRKYTLPCSAMLA